jgi:phosphate starvation-inducible protein PhoH
MSLENLFEKLEPKSKGQEELKKALQSDKDLIGIFGPTGTGKSLFAITYSLSTVNEGNYKRIILSRPIIDIVSGKEITLFNEPENYVKYASEYLKDILVGFVEEKTIEELIKNGKLLLADPHFLRGRTFDDSIIILDDVQSIPAEIIIEIITRMGRNSRLIIAGDPIFQRTAEFGKDGASLAREILLGEETATVIDLGIKDIVRPGAKRGVQLLLELQMRKRELDENERKVKEVAKIYAPDADIITVVNLTEYKRKFNITSENVPDGLVIVKEKHVGRLVGVKGERIQNIEKETNQRLRVIGLTLDLKEIIRAIHPVSWIHKYVVDFDFAGNTLRLLVDKKEIGAMIGQKGMFVRFIDEVFKKLLGVGIHVEETEQATKEQKKKK